MKKVLAPCFCIFITFLSFGQDTLSTNKAKSSFTILFICEHGAARSTIAAAYFNKLAQEQGLNYRAKFRGTNVDSVIGPTAQKGLLKDGFDILAWKPTPVTKDDIENAYQIVTVDCLLPEKDSITKPIIQWNGIPAVSKDYNLARDSIVRKVQALLTELSLKRN
jgi:arsenate reductase (thioredoxin)